MDKKSVTNFHLKKAVHWAMKYSIKLTLCNRSVKFCVLEPVKQFLLMLFFERIYTLATLALKTVKKKMLPTGVTNLWIRLYRNKMEKNSTEGDNLLRFSLLSSLHTKLFLGKNFALFF